MVRKIENFEKRRVLLLLSKIIKKSKTTEIERMLKSMKDESLDEKEVLLKISLEIKEMFGINLKQAQFLIRERLPIEILPELTKFIPAFENLKTVISAVYFYKPKEMSEAGIYEIKKQLKNSLCSFGYALVRAKLCIDELRL